MSNSKNSDFSAESFEMRLQNLKDTQDGIQQLSSWCLQNRNHHKKIVSSWLNVFKKVRVEHRLVLFYLANDVIQYSKRKRYEFVESWATALQRATTMVRDDKVKGKIIRIFYIWGQRDIYSEEYLSDLNGLLSMSPPKKMNQPQSDSVVDEFQTSTLINNVRDCVQFAMDTDKSFKHLPRMPRCDIEYIKTSIKEKSNSEDVENEINGYVTALRVYISNLKIEIESRRTLLSNMDKADTFFMSQRGEVKVVVNAYKNFGNRIKLVKKKLDEIAPNLPSPIPSPDINAPSPEPDSDIILPDDKISFNVFKSGNGFSSYMDGNLPFDISDFKSESNNSQPIEVISNRSDDNRKESFTPAQFYKQRDLYSTDNGVPLPVPPVRSEYSSLAHSGTSNYSDSHVPYRNPTTYSSINTNFTAISNYTSSSSNNSYEDTMPLMPPPPMPASLAGQSSEDFNSTWDMDMSWTSIASNSSFNNSLETPMSPPLFERKGHSANTIEYGENSSGGSMSVLDVDHRQLLIPPMGSTNQSIKKPRILDIDHRNLISLTGSPQQKVDTGAKKDHPAHKKNPDKVSPPANKPEVGYDPSDIVETIDMEMSDDDMEDLFREIAYETQGLENDDDISEESTGIAKQLNEKQLTVSNEQYLVDSQESANNPENGINQSMQALTRPALLDTPDYQPLVDNSWNSNACDNINMPNNAPAQNSNPFMGSSRVPFPTPGPLHSNQHRPFYQGRSAQFQFSRNQHIPRNFLPIGHQNMRPNSRPSRGQPYFNNNRGRGSMNIRGRFRGCNNW